MKRITKLAIALIAAAVALVAAGCGEKIGHEHSWGAEWKFNATEHWHACGGCDEKEAAGAHTGGTATCTAKAVCDVCGIAYGEEPEHSYEWKSDKDKHWQECSVCGDVKADSEGEHTGGSATCTTQATCETCNQAYGALSTEHDYSELRSDETEHWYVCADCGAPSVPSFQAHNYTQANKDDAQHWLECVCGAKGAATVESHSYTIDNGDSNHHWKECECGAIGEKEEHDINALGMCEICWKDVEDTYDMIDFVDMFTDAKSLVKAGATSYTSGTEGNWNSPETNAYEYRNGYFFVDNQYDGSNVYYMLKSNGDPYSVRVENGEARMNNYAYSAKNVKGFQFNSIILDSVVDFYGAEDLIAILQEEGDINANGDYTERFRVIDEKIVCTFSFGYYDKADGYFFRLNVEFILGEGDFLESATVYSYKYTSSQFEENADGKAVPTVETAFYNYKITLTQFTECENENVENPYDPAKVLISSFDLMTAPSGGSPVADYIELEADSGQNRYYLQNITPATALPELNPALFYINDSKEPADFFDARLMTTYISDANALSVNAQYQIGEFKLTFKMGDVQKDITFNVIPKTPMSLKPSVWSGEVYETKTLVETYEDMNVQFNAEANVSYADNSFTAEITSANAADATLVRDDKTGDYVFNGKVGVYTIELTSTRKSSVKTQLTIQVSKLPDLSNVLSGEYEYTKTLAGRVQVVYKATFTPDEGSGNLTGTVDVYWRNQGSVIYAYAYSPANGLVLTRTGGVATLTQTLVMDKATFKLYVEKDGTLYALTKVGGEIIEEEKDANADHPLYEQMKLLSGVHKQGVTLGDGAYYGNAEVAFTPTSATNDTLTGTVKFLDPQSEFEVEGTYTFTTSGGLQLDFGEKELVDDNTSYEILVSGSSIVVKKKNNVTGNVTPFTCTQENMNPDGYVVA
ncbi:MAG: hypothetical protein IJY34_00590 [Clostridia bacterium]|nr:hypothetical protein [Clostridia bacterium]